MNLFEIPESLSPRLAWMREHGIDVAGSTAMAACGKPDAFHAASIQYIRMGIGPTEDEALADFARKNKLKMWNESNL